MVDKAKKNGLKDFSEKFFQTFELPNYEIEFFKLQSYFLATLTCEL